MKLGELIKILQKLPQDTVFESGFTNPHSYRGSYYELAVEPKAFSLHQATSGICCYEQ
jgi:hypothetical protein